MKYLRSSDLVLFDINGNGKNFPPHFALIIGVFAVSTASTFIRLAQAEVGYLAISAWRLVFASLILTPFALKYRSQEIRDLSLRQWFLAFLSGIFLSIHFVTWIKSLELTSVAASVVLVTTYPIFVGIFSSVFLGEKLGRKLVIGLAVAFSGTIIISVGDLGQGIHMVQGDILALLGSLSAAGYFLIGRELRADLSLVGYIYPVYSISAIILVLITVPMGVRMTGFSSYYWVLLFFTALIPQIIGHSSLNWALKYLKATYVTLSVLGEPIGSTILAWLVLNEIPPLTSIIGGVVVLIGIYFAQKSRVKRET